MSGRDEQPIYPKCPTCEKDDLETTFWILGFVSVETRAEFLSSGVGDMRDYVYFDKEANKNRCVRTDKTVITRVILAATQYTDMYEDESIEKALAMLLSSVNIMKCSNEHLVETDTDLFKKVFDSIMRFAHVEGVKWE